MSVALVETCPIRIRLVDGTPACVLARVEESGLMAYHSREGHGFTVTHLPTGLALLRGARERKARDFVADVLWLGDWNFGVDDLWRGWSREQILRVKRFGIAADGSYPTAETPTKIADSR